HSPQAPTEDEKRARRNESPITPFDQIPSEAAMPHAVIGAELAARANLQVGDTATIISGETTLTPLGLAPRYRRVRIAGIFKSGLYEYDSTWVYLSLDTAASFAGATSPSASIISIEVTDIYAAEQTAARLREQFGAAYTTVTWQEANRPLFSLPADIYSISNVPFHTHALDVALAAAVALALSLLATIYPARAAARFHPAEALRDS